MTENMPSERHTDSDDDLRDVRDNESRPTVRADGDPGRLGEEVGDATERAEDDATSVDQITVGHKVSDESEDRIADHPERDHH